MIPCVVTLVGNRVMCLRLFETVPLWDIIFIIERLYPRGMNEKKNTIDFFMHIEVNRHTLLLQDTVTHHTLQTHLTHHT